MTAKAFSSLLVDLGIAESHSRPHVSDDNPFSEAQFKTVKYRPDFPARFGCIQHATNHCARLFNWYHHEHHHSGIALMTPADVHHGRAAAVQLRRATTLDAAYLRHPERFVRKAPAPPPLPSAVWINRPATADAVVVAQ